MLRNVQPVLVVLEKDIETATANKRNGCEATVSSLQEKGKEAQEIRGEIEEPGDAVAAHRRHGHLHVVRKADQHCPDVLSFRIKVWTYSTVSWMTGMK